MAATGRGLGLLATFLSHLGITASCAGIELDNEGAR